MKRLKKVLFWSHLILGAAGGLVIGLLALTGAIYAFEPQLSVYVQPASQQVVAQAGVPLLPPQVFVDRATVLLPGKTITTVLLYSDVTKPAYVQTSDRYRLYFHPQTGEVVASRSRFHPFTFAIELHTQLAAGDAGNWIIILSNAFFVLLCFTGLYLWWPKNWRLSTLRAIGRPNFKLTGKALSFNLHNAFGIWALAILIVISVTGLMMSFDWAANLPFTLSGQPVPEPPPVVKLDPSTPRFPINAVVADITARVPQWENVSVNPPTPKTGVYRARLRALDAPNLSARSILYVHGSTGADLRWEPFQEFSTARRLQTYALPLHMGTIIGVPGRAVSFTASLAALVLVYTGYALVWKRFLAWRKRRARAPEVVAPVATRETQLVS